jgi:hypothetical protein
MTQIIRKQTCCSQCGEFLGTYHDDGVNSHRLCDPCNRFDTDLDYIEEDYDGECCPESAYAIPIHLPDYPDIDEVYAYTETEDIVGLDWVDVQWQARHHTLVRLRMDDPSIRELSAAQVAEINEQVYLNVGSGDWVECVNCGHSRRLSIHGRR